MSFEPMWLSLLSLLPNLLLFVFLLAAILFVATRPSDGSSAKVFALTGLGIHLVLRIVSVTFTLIVPRMADVEQLPIYFGLHSAFSTLFHMVGIGLLVAAVFARRPDTQATYQPGPEHFPTPSSNPYTPPAN